jgi:hypothetical protein
MDTGALSSLLTLYAGLPPQVDDGTGRPGGGDLPTGGLDNPAGDLQFGDPLGDGGKFPQFITGTGASGPMQKQYTGNI